MGGKGSRFEAERIARHAEHPEAQTTGDYYLDREVDRETCGAIAGMCFLAAVLVVIVWGIMHAAGVL